MAHLVKFAMDGGIEDAAAANLMVIVGLSQLVGNVLGGRILDRIIPKMSERRSSHVMALQASRNMAPQGAMQRLCVLFEPMLVARAVVSQCFARTTRQPRNNKFGVVAETTVFEESSGAIR